MTTSGGACAATSSPYPPTARHETNAWAGPATFRYSRRPRCSCTTARRSWTPGSPTSAWSSYPTAPSPGTCRSSPAHQCGRPSSQGQDGDAAVLTPVALYEETGDAELLRRHYSAARRWVDLVANLAGPTRLWDTGFQLGDWLDPTAPARRPRGRCHRPVPDRDRLLRMVSPEPGADSESPRRPGRRQGIRGTGRAGGQGIPRQVPDGRRQAHLQYPDGLHR